MGNLKSKLTNRQLTIGTWVTIGHQSIVEILATAGFEWITIDMEHSVIGYETMLNLIAHIQGNGMEALVRVSKNEEVPIKKAMDAGANGVIVPMIKNELDAINAVSYVKYPPIGKRGVGLSRAHKYGIDFDNYKNWLNNEAVVIAQIEHIEAVENLNDILSTEGLDGIIIGPYDLSASMGYPGEYERSDVKKALQRVISVTKKSNKSLGSHVIESNSMHVKNKINEGYTFLAFSLDFFLGDKAREEMKKLRE